MLSTHKKVLTLSVAHGSQDCYQYLMHPVKNILQLAPGCEEIISVFIIYQ